jgi:NAD(P)-dependent dehydrogenase (short-subunit alcohol dehydrogenase family)
MASFTWKRIGQGLGLTRCVEPLNFRCWQRKDEIMNIPKTVVITGATRGCGRAMVARFVEEGHIVIGCGRSADSVAEMRKRFAAPHRFDAIDVSDDGQVATWAKSVQEAGLVPDLLLNNAAIINHNAPLWRVPADEFQRVVNINIVGTANIIRHFVPAMIQRMRGTIVNFSSGWGRSTAPEVAPYCATKFAIEGLSQALAQELPPGMAAVALNPGIINTEMLQSCWADGAQQYPSPDRWSKVAVPFLLSLGPKDNGRPLTVPL